MSLKTRIRRWLNPQIRESRNDIPIYPGFVSYSQCGEDGILRFLFNAMQIESPTYLDIGSNHPSYLSNSFAFYRLGCRGVCVEPNPFHAAAFRATRPMDILREVGVMPERGGPATLYLFDPDTMSTFVQSEAERSVAEFGYRLVSTAQVEVVTINDLIEGHFPAGPDFISIDVEGMDTAIVQSCDLRRRPRVFCVETIEHSTTGAPQRRIEPGNWLKTRGYLEIATTPVNSIFVDEEMWNSRGRA